MEEPRLVDPYTLLHCLISWFAASSHPTTLITLGNHRDAGDIGKTKLLYIIWFYVSRENL